MLWVGLFRYWHQNCEPLFIQLTTLLWIFYPISDNNIKRFYLSHIWHKYCEFIQFLTILRVVIPLLTPLSVELSYFWHHCEWIYPTFDTSIMTHHLSHFIHKCCKSIYFISFAKLPWNECSKQIELWSSSWCFVYFAAQISLLTLLAESIGADQLSSFRSLRTLRALRPLRAISRWQGMRVSRHVSGDYFTELVSS